MKLTNIIVIVVLVLLCAFGWMALASDNISQKAEFETFIAQAEDCIERGLYQRAIENYLSALNGKDDEEIYLKIADAYSERCKEAPEDTFDGYLKFTKKALDAFPGNRTLVKHLVSLCVNEEQGTADYRTLYPYLKKAVSNGCDDEATLDLYVRTRYAYSLRGNFFQAVVDAGAGSYSVLTEHGWNIYEVSGGYRLASNWDYVGPCDSNGVTVITGEDSQLFDVSSFMVLGKFRESVTDAGIYAEGLIPVQVDGKYGYYNDYADYQFGSFDYAGTFQNGLAAVETGGKWMLVNAEGETDRDDFERIVTDLSDRYLVNDVIMVKEDGDYVIYNAKWERQASLDCDEVDILSKDGIVAFRSGSKWGFADMASNIVIEPEYINARSFSNGLAAVQNSDGLWGFINRENRLVIDCTFTDVGYMSSEGICPVRVDEPSTAPVYDYETGEEIVIPEQWVFLNLANGITKD